MHHNPSRTVLTWVLVVGVFAGLVVFWIPSFVQTIQTLAGEVGKDAKSSTAEFSTEWNLTQQQIQVLGETISAVTKEQNTISKEQMDTFVKEVDAKVSVVSQDPATFPVHEDTALVVVPETDPNRAYCTRNGGQAVSRKQKDHDYSVCIFKDGSECEVTMFARGSCRMSQFRNAEDGMKKLPDFILTVKKAGYCTARTSPVSWTDDASAPYICLEGVTIKNIGWGDGGASAIKTAGKYYQVPAITAGEQYTFSDVFPFVKAKVNNQAVIVVDAKNNAKESNEDNNIYTFPQ